MVRNRCRHKHRIHALGGGQFVCFKCWVGLLLGRKVMAKASPKGGQRT